MASTNTAIEWTDRTWNPTTGCNKVSPGCKFCYAEGVAKRFTNHFPNGFDFVMKPERLDQPRRWRKPSRIFVDSMSDLFHEEMPLEFLQAIFKVMTECPQHVLLGVSVENQDYTRRVDALRAIPAAVRFLSCEPLLGPLSLNLEGIHWVITGGESGLKRRALEPDWVRSIRDQCAAADVAYFHKQWGGRFPSAEGRELDGVIHDGMPGAWALHLNAQVITG
jgi:protein gp37